MALALERIEELFRKLDHVNDALTTKSHFSLAQLGVIEAVVLAVVDANFSLGATARRWLDEDEYSVRRRIHRDLRVMMTEKTL
jgi:cellulose synthase operon protein C